MKVFVAIVLAIGSVSALGSGPYLPSGWRPQGPAFFLPSEVQKPVVSVKEAVIEETVESGSDFLREYGPPKVVEVSQDLTNQGLPDAVTEQTFLGFEAKFNQEALTSSVAEKSQESAANAEKGVVETVTLGIISVEEPTTLAPVAIEEITIVEKSDEVIQGTTEEKSAEVIQETTQVKFAEVVEDATTELREETTTETVALDAEIAAVELVEKVESFQNVQESTEVESTEKSIVVSQEIKQSAVLEQTVQTVEEVVQVEVKAVEESVKNIAEALVNLENEIKVEQVQTQGEIKTVQENASLEQGPVGFLEYGPPGFREYGPPTEDDLLRSTLTQEPSEVGSFENNETRKRRFSPKFKPTNNKERKQH